LISLNRIKQIKINPRSKVFTLFVGNFKSAFKGRGVEVADIRPYVPGDNVKHIAWNVTAKSGDVYVKEFAETRELNIHFAVDNSSSMNLAEWGSEVTKKDTALQIIYLLGLAANHFQDKVGASMYDNKLRMITRSKKGNAQLIFILNKYFQNSQPAYYESLDLESYLKFLTKKLSHRTVCIFFTDNIDISNRSVTKALKAINLKHDLIIVDIYELYREPVVVEGKIALEDIETGISITVSKSEMSNYNDYLLLEKSKVANQMRKYGIDYLSIDTHADLLKELIGFFKVKSHKHVYN